MNNLYVKAYNQIIENDYDIYIKIDKINYRLPIEDNGDQSQYTNLYGIIKIKDDCEIYKIIDKYLEQNKRCCIFCNQGRQRSCTVYTCYLIYKGFSIINSTNKKDAFFGNINFIDTINMFYNYVHKKS